ncbi:MAG TPA: hypothetical protein VFL17_22380 [Anaerolineae bacterium]|nr:hypothetical protein [Anaerolineae bacterium]
MLQGLLVLLIICSWVYWLVALCLVYDFFRRARPLPVRDMLSALVWLAGGFGRRVIWRGEEFVLVHEGRMHPVSPGTVGSEAGHLRGGSRGGTAVT